MNDLISPIREQLEEQMHKQCKSFLANSKGDKYSPRYYNTAGRPEAGLVCIESTQTSVGFCVDIPKEFEDLYKYAYTVDTFWDQFKKFRTEFLIKHYPEINPY
jgi:hypothetical protein